MPKTQAAQIHVLTSQFLQVGDIHVAPAQVWEEDGGVVGSRVAIVLSGMYVTGTDSVSEGDGNGVDVTNGDGSEGHDLYVEITVDMARRMAELLVDVVDEC